MTQTFLFLHLLGAFCFFAGGALVGVLQLAAIKAEKPSQVYAYLRLAPIGAALVGSGALLTLVFGIGLVQHEGIGFSTGWIQAAFGLWIVAMVLGAWGGRTARHARHLAEKLAAEGDEPSPGLHAMVAARGPLYASYASFAVLLAIVVLMVWQPGASSQAAAPIAYPTAVQKQILRASPQLAYAPTLLPTGAKYSDYEQVYPHPEEGYHVVYKGKDGQDALSFSVYHSDYAYPGTCKMSPPPSSPESIVTANGYEIAWDHESGGIEAAWRCVGRGKSSLILQADARKMGVAKADLVNLVAYAVPFGPGASQ